MGDAGDQRRSRAVWVRDLRRRFGAVQVLRGLDLEVTRGEQVALLGANGSGKTTLLRILAGLVAPDSGEVSVLGTAVPGGPELRRRLGMLGHETWLYSDLSGRENLSFYARLYGVEGEDRVAGALEAVGLAETADRAVRTYSRGMTQRLSLARAALHEPELLLLDEPYTGLDPNGAELLREMLETLHGRGITVLLATNDLERGLEGADRAVLLRGGRLAWHSDGRPPPAGEMKEIYRTITARPQPDRGQR